jgi:hypothetical protein
MWRSLDACWRRGLLPAVVFAGRGIGCVPRSFSRTPKQELRLCRIARCDPGEGDSLRVKFSPFSRKQPLTPNTLLRKSGAREQSEHAVPTQLNFVTHCFSEKCGRLARRAIFRVHENRKSVAISAIPFR